MHCATRKQNMNIFNKTFLSKDCVQNSDKILIAYFLIYCNNGVFKRLFVFHFKIL